MQVFVVNTILNGQYNPDDKINNISVENPNYTSICFIWTFTFYKILKAHKSQINFKIKIPQNVIIIDDKAHGDVVSRFLAKTLRSSAIGGREKDL